MERKAPDKVQTGFDRVVEVKNECNTAGLELNLVPVCFKPEP